MRYLKALAIVACLAVFGYWGVWLPLRASGYDFTGPYEAAYALAHHASFSVYDVAAQRAYSANTLHLPAGPSDFRWTPTTAVLLMPLGLLPYAAARVLWWVIGLAALLTSVWLLARSAAQASAARVGYWSAFAALGCAAAVAQPVTDSLRLGQSTTILLLGFALIAYGEVFDRQALSGIGLAVTILDKLFPGALLLYFLWRGRYRVCAVALGVVALLCLLTLPVTGLGIYSDFLHALTAFSAEPDGGPVNLSPLHALIVLALSVIRPGQPEVNLAPLIALAGLICAALFGATILANGWPIQLRRWRGAVTLEEPAAQTPMARLGMIAWTITALFIIEPVDWGFYYVVALVPLAWLLSGPAAGAPHIGRWPVAAWRWLAGLSLILALAPLPLDSRTASSMSLLYVIGIAARPVGLLGLWLAQAMLLWPGSRKVVAIAADAAPARETRFA